MSENSVFLAKLGVLAAEKSNKAIEQSIKSASAGNVGVYSKTLESAANVAANSADDASIAIKEALKASTASDPARASQSASYANSSSNSLNAADDAARAASHLDDAATFQRAADAASKAGYTDEALKLSTQAKESLKAADTTAKSSQLKAQLSNTTIHRSHTTAIGEGILKDGKEILRLLERDLSQIGRMLSEW